MILKVISDGNPQDTIIVNAETGEKVDGVCEIDWHLDNKNLSLVTIKLYADCEIITRDIEIEKVEIEAGAACYTEIENDTLKEVNRI